MPIFWSVFLVSTLCMQQAWLSLLSYSFWKLLEASGSPGLSITFLFLAHKPGHLITVQ